VLRRQFREALEALAGRSPRPKASSRKKRRGDKAHGFAYAAKAVVGRLVRAAESVAPPLSWDGLAWLHLWVWNDRAGAVRAFDEMQRIDVRDDLPIHL